MRQVAVTTTAASAAILTGSGVFYGAHLVAGSDAATLIVYDNTSGTGTVVVKLSASAANTTDDFCPCVGIPIKTGIYATVTGTTPSATLLFTP